MSNLADVDYISDLPQSIVESILTRLPIKDAVRTSILSSKWRYRWNSLTHLVFDDRCGTPLSNDRVFEKSLVNFVTRALFLHHGPIHKFQLCTSRLESYADIDQWILFLTRNDVKELVLELGEVEWYRVPMCLFSCRKLTRLELFRCELDPPPTFKGFMCMKSLNLHQVSISPEAIECLISGCPLLESLGLSYLDSLNLNIHAPNLKYLCLEGEFKDICLENTPLLVSLSVAIYMTEEVAEHFEQSSGCNYVKFLGGVPLLEKLVGHIYFTKFLSIGDDPRRVPITYNNLKIIELYQVSFEDMKEILIILQLINNSPNLEELHVSGSTIPVVGTEAPHLDFSEKECISDCPLKKLKVVKITHMSGLPQEMEFIKLLLGNSPVLAKMSITPSGYVTYAKLNLLIQLVKFRRASPKAEIVFIHE